MPTHHRAAAPTALHGAGTSMCCTSTASFQLKTEKPNTSTAWCPTRVHNWEKQLQWQQKPAEPLKIHSESIQTWVRQSSWSCCNNPAAPRSCRRCCGGRRTRTIYQPSKPPPLRPLPRWPPSPGTCAPPPWSENGARHGRPLPGNSPLWSCGRGSPERSPGIPRDHPWRERAHTGRRRAGGRSSRLQAPDSLPTSVQTKHVKGLQLICHQPSLWSCTLDSQTRALWWDISANKDPLVSWASSI